MDPKHRSWVTPLAAAVLGAAAFAAYHNTFTVPYLLDDDGAIRRNPALDFSRPLQVLFPPVEATTAARPLLNVSFALNNAVNGFSVGGYHFVNLLIHFLAALTLFGILRQVFGRRLSRRSPAEAEGFRQDANTLALVLAAVWMLHPLQTESVTYISQRAESMAGLFVLLAIYCFVRSADRWTVDGGQKTDPNQPSTVHGLPSTIWLTLSVAAAICGIATKETAVIAPVAVLLIDRVFFAGTFRDAWKLRRGLYLGYGASWVLLGIFFMTAPAAGRGVATGGVFLSFDYLITEVGVITHYLRLAFWPSQLVFDYGPTDPPGQMPAALAIILLVTVLGALGWRWFRKPGSGKQEPGTRNRELVPTLVGTLFLLALAPSSSVVPVTFQPAAENRMYLALAAIVIGIGLLGYRYLGRIAIAVLAALAVVLGICAERRNEDYRDEHSIWMDTALKRPNNWRAQYNLGLTFQESNRPAEAIARYENALQLKPDIPEAHNNIGTMLAVQPGKLPEAIVQYEEAVKIRPDYGDAHLNLADALASTPGRAAEALRHYDRAVTINPRSVDAQIRYGNALLAIPARAGESIPHFETALAFRPDSTEARVNLAAALYQAGRIDDAIAALEESIRRDPEYTPAKENLTRLKSLRRPPAP